MSSETIWLYGLPGSYHDISCGCDGHCLNCFADMAEIRALRERLIAEGVSGPSGPYTEADRLHPRARYCSPYCKGRAKRERALDRALAVITVRR